MSDRRSVLDETPVTLLVALAYVTLAVVTDFGSGDLVAHGAAVGIRIQDGEVWRLITHAFLHGGLLHLAFNTYFLIVVGPALERSMGSLRFALLYLLSAVGGGIAGSLWHFPMVPLVGGSGALFGMLGAAVALNMRAGRHLLDFLSYQGPRQLIFLIVVNLAIGWLIPVVSNAAHIGGLVAGFVLVFCFLDVGRRKPDRTGRAIQGGWIALYAAALLYACEPVLRWDHLLTRFEAAPSQEEGRAAARALVHYVMREGPIPATPDLAERLEAARRAAR